MNTSTFGRYALTVCAATTLLSACGGALNSASSGSKYVPGAAASRGSGDALQYRVLHSFHGQDGAYPVASLIDVHGTLYGATTAGRTRGLQPKNGVVFSVTTSGKERVVHDFGVLGRDGAYPGAALIDVHGTLYGTTELGDQSNTGTVYSVTTSGEEHVLHGFGSSDPSPMQPSASLIDVNGSLYTTSNRGGASNLGSVFSISTGGEERVLHSFGHPYRTDGQIPAAPLLDVHGALYGTTYQGGIYRRGNSCGNPCPGDGTVFRITTDGKERVLHSFGNGSDGVTPDAGLIDVNGTLFGTTAAGGKYGHGTVFSITTGGQEHVLYSFGSRTGDGAVPGAGLIDVGGTLYGTTGGGGAYRFYGTVFSVSTSGAGERVLHSFGAPNDGTDPQAGLLDVNGTLYGTTEKGGTNDRGTVFAIAP